MSAAIQALGPHDELAAELARAIDPKARGHGAAWAVRCPVHHDTVPSLSIRDGARGVLLTCFAGCARSDIVAELKRRGIWPGRLDRPLRGLLRCVSRQSEPGSYEVLQPWGWRLWSVCRPITPGTAAATYLKHRGCAIPHSIGDLRWHRDLADKMSGYRGPALVGLVTDALTGEAINLHRTWLAKDGSGKAPVEKPRRLLKGHPSRGVIRLWPEDGVTLGLVIGEGIETSLAAARAGLTPVWATLSAGNLAAFPVLPGLEGLTVLVDHDRHDNRGRRAGILAALELVRRYAAADFAPTRDLFVTLPHREGLDVADLVSGALDGRY
jgi:putative DNA primase/helicase